MLSSILPKNQRKQFDLRYHSSKVEFFRSLLGRIEDTTNTFRNYLTFKTSINFNFKTEEKSRKQTIIKKILPDLELKKTWKLLRNCHLQKNPVELFQYFCQKRLSVIRLQKYELISIVLQKLVTRRPSVKLFRQNSRIRYKRENHWSWAHFLTFPIVKERKWNKKKSFWTIRGTLSSWRVVELSLEIGQSHFSSWWSLFVFIDGGTKQFLGFEVSRFSYQGKCDLLKLHVCLF